MLIPNKHSGYLAGIRLYPGGKGGSSAPPPDPRLIEAQIKSMGIQDDAIQEIMRNASEMAPLQKQQLQFGLDTAKTAYNQSQEDRTWMLGRRSTLSGMQDRMASDANNFNTAERQQQLAGEAAADVTNAFNNVQGQQQRAMTRMGVNPASGRFAAVSNQNALAQAAATAGVVNKTRQAARTEGYALTDRATNALAGYPAMGMSATGAGAGYGASGVNIANAGLAGMNSGWGAAGSVAGSMGANAAQMYGTMGNYKNQADQIANSDGGFMGAVGMLGGAAITKYSDRRLKENIVLVGKDEKTGLNLYEFNYKTLPEFRMRGVMADEVEEIIPSAVERDENGYMRVDYDQIGIELVRV